LYHPYSSTYNHYRLIRSHRTTEARASYVHTHYLYIYIYAILYSPIGKFRLYTYIYIIWCVTHIIIIIVIIIVNLYHTTIIKYRVVRPGVKTTCTPSIVQRYAACVCVTWGGPFAFRYRPRLMAQYGII